MNDADPDKQRIADALAALSGGDGDGDGDDPDHGPRRAAVRDARPVAPSAPTDPGATTPGRADPRGATTPAAPVASQHRDPLEVRRTLIPVLLTGGVLLIVTGLLKWLAGPTSVLASLSAGLCVALIAGGVLAVATGVLNALHVRHALADAHAGAGAGRPRRLPMGSDLTGGRVR